VYERVSMRSIPAVRVDAHRLAFVIERVDVDGSVA
jgi:hypothetical protein